MFSSTTDLFHFIFADTSDDYYTSSLVKIDFDAYLWFRLMQEEYTCIVNVKKLEFCSDYELEVTGLQWSVKNKQESDEKKQSKFKKWLMGNQGKEENVEEYLSVVQDSSVRRSRRDKKNWNEMQTVLYAIVDFMRNNSKIALVMTLHDFNRFCEDKNNREVLMSIKNNNHYNIIVLLADVDASESDKYFVKTDSKRGVQGFEGFKSVIYDYDMPNVKREELFPEIKKAFRPELKNQEKLVFTYDVLKKALGNRMHIWNDFSYEKVLDIVKYRFVRENTLMELCTPEFCSYAIYLWYNNLGFREKYPASFLEKNKRHSFRELAFSIEPFGIRKWIECIIEGEQTDDVSELKKNGWSEGTKELNIGYFSDEYQPLMIVKLMKKYKEIIEKNSYNLGDNKDKLIMMINQFQRPGFASRYNEQLLPHQLFEKYYECEDYCQMIEKLFKLRLESSKWNGWDESCVEIIFLLFDICREYAEMKCDEDMSNEIGRIQIEQGFQLLEFGMQQAKDKYYDNEGASEFEAECRIILGIRDRKEVKKMQGRVAYLIGKLK